MLGWDHPFKGQPRSTLSSSCGFRRSPQVKATGKTHIKINKKYTRLSRFSGFDCDKLLCMLHYVQCPNNNLTWPKSDDLDSVNIDDLGSLSMNMKYTTVVSNLREII